MKVKQLRKILNDLPKDADNLNVWLGSDSGEGYPMADHAFVGNAKFMPLDLDDGTDQEHDYLDVIPKNKANSKKWIVEDDGESVWGEVFLVGGYRSKEDYDEVFHHYKNRVEIAKQSLIEEKKELEKEMAKLTLRLSEIMEEGNPK